MANERREQLKALSISLRPLVQSGEFDTINQAVVAHYRNEEDCTEFKTLKEWNEEGKRIKRGSKGFAVWARPKQKRNEQDEEAEELGFFPICYLFHDKQVA